MFDDVVTSCEQPGVPLPLTGDLVQAAARAGWGEHVTVVPPGRYDVELRLDVTAGTDFSISVMKGWSSITVDGTPEQHIDAAVWLRCLMPADGPPIVAFDSGPTVDVVLEAGTTVEHLAAAVAPWRPGRRRGPR